MSLGAPPLPLKPGSPGSSPLRPGVLLCPQLHVAGVQGEQMVLFGGRNTFGIRDTPFLEAALDNRRYRAERVRKYREFFSWWETEPISKFKH